MFTLKRNEVDKANQLVNVAVEEKKASARGHYSNYMDTDRARIGKYAAQNCIARPCHYFANTWNTNIRESTVRRFKVEYLKKLATMSTADNQLAGSEITSIPKKALQRPLHLGSELDKAIQYYLKALRAAGGVVNTVIDMAAVEGILIAQCPGRLQKQGGAIYRLPTIGPSH